MPKPRPVKLNIPAEPMFSYTPCGDGWRIDIASYLTMDSSPLCLGYLGQSDNWTLAQISTLVEMLTEATYRYQDYLIQEQDKGVCLEAEQTANYKVKCVGCGAEMVLALGPGDREEGGHVPVQSGG